MVSAVDKYFHKVGTLFKYTKFPCIGNCLSNGSNCLNGREDDEEAQFSNHRPRKQ